MEIIVLCPNIDLLPLYTFHRQISLIRELQIEMNSMGAVIKTLPHLARPSDHIAKEVLAFTCIMLFNANSSVQVRHLD